MRSGSLLLLVVVAGGASGSVACARANAEDHRGNSANAPVGIATLQVATLPIAAPAPSTQGALPAENSSDCPDGMVLVDGEYCPEVEHECLEWMDPPSSRYHHFRCARYAHGATCKKPRVHKRFCIDRTERAEGNEATGTEALPRNNMSWTSSRKLCEKEGARLCFESEWQFACEGEEMRPYPYGWERDKTACNVDIETDIGKIGRLVDHRQPVGHNPKCASPFGVQDMAGNVEEWTRADGGQKMGWKEVLKGSWWIPSRHACRQFQVGHNDVYAGRETGTRCCKDAVRATSSRGSTR